MSRKRRRDEQKSRKEGSAPGPEPSPDLHLPKDVKALKGSAPIQMADVLLDFIAPYLKSLDSEDHLNNLLTMAMVAWNAANLPSDKAADLVEGCLQELPGRLRADGLAVIQTLMERKKTHFSGNRRAIVDFHLTMTPKGPHVHVVSSPPAT